MSESDGMLLVGPAKPSGLLLEQIAEALEPRLRRPFEWATSRRRGLYFVDGGAKAAKDLAAVKSVWAMRSTGPGWVPLGTSHALPRLFHAIALLEGRGDAVCLLNIVVDEHGQPRCRQLELLTSAGVTGTLLRKIPLESIVTRARDLVALQLTWRDDGSLDVDRVARHGEEGLDALERAYQGRAEPRRGVRLSDRHLRRVADIYRDALAAKRPPTREVMLKLHTSRSNAGRWVAAARERGFLSKTEPRKARG